MRKFSFVACLLGCALLGLLAPGPASAAIVATLQIDDLTETPSASGTGFNSGSFTSSLDTSSGNEVVSFAGIYTANANAFNTASVHAFVVLTEPGSTTISDILDITFSQTGGSKLISINGTFTSGGDGGPALVSPGDVPTIAETGDWQDVSGHLQDQGFRSDISVLLRSGVDSNGNVVPEPASMIVWSFIACCVGVPGLRRRWRTATRAV
jgi:hypothetical protein